MPPNYSVFNQEEKPLYVHTVNPVSQPVTVNDPGAAAAIDGKFFAVSTGSQTVAANGFLVVQGTVPINVGKTIYITRISGGATVNTTIDFFLNANFATTGTSVTPANTNAGSVNTSVVTAKFLSQATDPTTGGVQISSIIQIGGPVVIDINGRYIIPSSTSVRTFYLRLANNANETNLLSININWWELMS